MDRLQNNQRLQNILSQIEGVPNLLAQLLNDTRQMTGVITILRSEIDELKSTVREHEDTIRQLRQRAPDQDRDDDWTIPENWGYPNPRSSSPINMDNPWQHSGPPSPLSSPVPALQPPPPAPEAPPAASRSQHPDHLSSVLQRMEDAENSKWIVITLPDLPRVLSDLNNQHTVLGNFVPVMKRALATLGLEEITFNATNYKLQTSGALKIRYPTAHEARRHCHMLRRLIGQNQNRLMIKFSTVLGARHSNERKIFSEAARRLKNDGTITSWDILHMGRRGLIMKTWNRRRLRTFFTLDQAREIIGEERREEMREE